MIVTRINTYTSAPRLNEMMLLGVLTATFKAIWEVVIRFPARTPLCYGHNLISVQ